MLDAYIASLGNGFLDDDPGAADKLLEAANIERLQEQYRALDRGDWDAVREFLAEDIEYSWSGPAALPFVGSATGRDEVMARIAYNFSLVQDQSPEVLAVTAQGNVVVVRLRETGTFRATGRPYDVEVMQVFTFDDGRIRSFHAHDNGALLDAIAE